VINGKITGRYSFRGTRISDAAVFVETRLSLADRHTVLLRVEGFNVLNHANILARNGAYGDATAPLASSALQVQVLPQSIPRECFSSNSASSSRRKRTTHRSSSEAPTFAFFDTNVISLRY
ncbi:MAG: hypothetical protein DMG14_34130, partial [Acidobacteria bacterium]